MKYYSIKIGNIKRELPIVALSPKMKVASFNLLGDLELVNVSARRLCNKIKNLDLNSVEFLYSQCTGDTR